MPKRCEVFVHGVYVGDNTGGAVVANVKDVDTNVSRLTIFENPKRPFWVTKESLRNHKYKKECAHEADLDMYVVPEHELPVALTKALYGRSAKPRYIRSLMQSPYVYGADIDVCLIIKKKMNEACAGRFPSEFRIGFMDIEFSVTGSEDINVITYLDLPTKTCYTGYLKSFNKDGDISGILQSKYKQTLIDFKRQMKPELQHWINPDEFVLVSKEFDDDIDMLYWTFGMMHMCKPDFCGIWNENYDIPKIKGRLEIHGIDLTELFCHPDVPLKYRYVNYYINANKQKTGNFAELWPWLTATGYTQFYDAMCLFARLRKSKGALNSNTLDYVSSLTLGTGKLHFGNADHLTMQTTRFTDYIIYNCVDNILMLAMELIQKNVMQLLLLMAKSLLNDFDKQTVQARNFFYYWCRNNKRVPASVAGELTLPGDELIVNVGGNVLDPKMTKDTAVSILQETPISRGMHMYVADSDAVSFYPRLLQSCNIAKETKLYTIIQMKDGSSSDIEDLCENMADPEANAVYIGHKFFGLPNYSEMLMIYTGSSIISQHVEVVGPIGWSRYEDGGYEVSSQGDRRFSALFAKLPNGQTVEEAYQLDVKGYREQTDDWRDGKGKPPLNALSRDELYRRYKELWQLWANNNPELIKELWTLSSGKKLTDRFATSNINQARALYDILSTVTQ